MIIIPAVFIKISRRLKCSDCEASKIPIKRKISRDCFLKACERERKLRVFKGPYYFVIADLILCRLHKNGISII